MYGFVNLAIREFVLQDHGTDFWNQITSEVSGISDIYLPDQAYDDALTYGIVGAIASKLEIPVPQALEAFGEFWVSFVDKMGYGALLSGNGRNLQDFLSNLDNFHSQLAIAYPDFTPPQFEYVDHGDGHLEIDYESERPGLAPMVTGILKGLAKRYETEIEIAADCQEFQGKFDITIVNQTVSL